MQAYIIDMIGKVPALWTQPNGAIVIDPRWHLLIPADVHRISWGDMRDAKRDKTSKHC